MRVVFRTDASLDIGTGHLMRCLTLADALRERGAGCRFICRAHPGNLLDLIRQRGYEAHALSLGEVPVAVGPAPSDLLPAHAAWLGADMATDAQQTLAAIGAAPVDWLIIDHYGIDARWESSLRTACRRLMVIDDLADRRHDADLLLDQNLGRNPADYAALVPQGCTVLVGPKHALLRPEFAALRPYSLARRANPQLKHLLITLGGVDKDNVTSEVLDALRVCPLPRDCRITVVMGAQALWLEQVRDRAEAMPWPTAVRVNIADMASLMADSDLAIGAAGSTSWERCCMGLPSFLIVLACNQQLIAEALNFAGAAKTTSKLTLAADVEEVLGEDAYCSSILARTSRRAANIASGQGTDFVSETIFAKASA